MSKQFTTTCTYSSHSILTTRMLVK